MRHLILGFAVMGFISFSAMGSSEDEDLGRLHSLMHTFYRNISALRPYLVSEAKFNSPQAQKEIKQSLDELVEKTSGSAIPEKIDKTPGFKITFSLLADHFKRTRDAYEHGEREYARARLAGTTNLCVTCHTQIPDKHNSFGSGSLDGNLDKLTFENAEFQFITRRFDHALDQFDQLARGYPKSQLPSDELSQVYRRKIAIFARVKRDPGLAIDDLKKDLANTKLPVDVQQNLKTWIEVFQAWKNETNDPAKLSDEELIKFAEANITAVPDRKIAPADPNMIKYLRISGLLYERLMNNPRGPRVPDMLYYLGLCERNISNNYWYSLNDVYWKECIVKYPKQPITKKCYDAYEASMNARFSGKPPPWMRTSIEALRDYL